jgi:hypothetical protein
MTRLRSWAVFAPFAVLAGSTPSTSTTVEPRPGGVEVRHAVAHDRSPSLQPLQPLRVRHSATRPPGDGIAQPSAARTAAVASRPPAIEQTTQGTRPPATLVANFDGIGVGFVGPQGSATTRNPSDNSLAVGPNHIVQIVNSRMAIFTKRGKQYDTTGRVLYGPVETRNVFKSFGGPCEQRNNGDAVARYDQLADRWLIVMPIFSRIPEQEDARGLPRDGEPARRSLPGVPGQPSGSVKLFEPPAPPPPPPARTDSQTAPRDTTRRRPQQPTTGVYAMCYAVSVGADPFGPYYRYEFIRPLFPDYPRPAVWPDGYYVPTSTSDDLIQKHACVVERAKMLVGGDATEQCVIIDDVNFLNNADVDGKAIPPKGAPNIMFAGGGTQLKHVMDDSVIHAWSFHVDWADPSKTRVTKLEPIAVAPYHYLCDGQLTNCVPQPETDRRLDAQGDKLMARLTYRRVAGHESLIAVHSVNTSAGGGGVRWYEFRLDPQRKPVLYQQGTYAPDSGFRWMGSAAMDSHGNIGIGYSYGDAHHFTGQRFAGRLASDPPGRLSLRETTLVEGEAAQTNTLRWEDYTQTGVDPSDDCTIWYVGDYLKRGATSYSTRIGAFRMPGCGPASAR